MLDVCYVYIMLNFSLHLVDPKLELCEAWARHFATLPNVEITQGRFEEIEDYECLINAGNSFGIMDGGVDGFINQAFPTVADRAQRMIINQYAGEQPVGTSVLIPTGSEHPFYLAHTPTMRVPETIAHTDNVYYAMRAALLAIQDHNKHAQHDVGESYPRSMNFKGFRIRKAVCMGLGTATGRVPFDKAAYQMALAYQSVLIPITQINWNEAKKRHNAVRALDIGHQPV
jgi:O-acetyl-ADP-ribose deacetylase (regulator of RNase III)